MITKLLLPIAGMALAVSMGNARAADPIALTESQMDAITAGEFMQLLIFMSEVASGVFVSMIPGVFSPSPFVFINPFGTPVAGQDSASISGPNNTGANARATGDVADASVSNQGGIFTAVATSVSVESR